MGTEGTRALSEMTGMSPDVAEELLTALRNKSGVVKGKVTLRDTPDDQLKVTISDSRGAERWLVFALPLNEQMRRSAYSEMPVAVRSLDLFTLPVADAYTEFTWNNGTDSWDAAPYLPTRRNVIDFYAEVRPTPEEILAGAAALWFLGKLADAYISKLADILAETTVTAVKRIRLRRKVAEAEQLTIQVPYDVTTVFLPKGDLPEEAKLAFIDLDPTADGVRGKVLYWNAEARVWEPVKTGQQHPQ